MNERIFSILCDFFIIQKLFIDEVKAVETNPVRARGFFGRLRFYQLLLGPVCRQSLGTLAAECTSSAVPVGSHTGEASAGCTASSCEGDIEGRRSARAS